MEETDQNLLKWIELLESNHWGHGSDTGRYWEFLGCKLCKNEKWGKNG